MKKTLLFFGGLCTGYWLRTFIVPIFKKLPQENWNVIYCLSCYEGSFTKIEKEDIVDIKDKDNIRFIMNEPPCRLDSISHNDTQKQKLKDFFEPLIGDINPDIVIARTSNSQYLNLLFPNIKILNAMEANFPPLYFGSGFILLDNKQPLIGLPCLEEKKQVFKERLFQDISPSSSVELYDLVSKDSLNLYKAFIDNLKKKYQKVIFFPFDCLSDAVLYFEANTEYGSYKETAHKICNEVSNDYAIIVSFHHIDLSKKSEEELKAYFPQKDNLYFINFEEGYHFNQIKLKAKGSNFLSPTHSLVSLSDHIIIMNSKTVFLAIYYNKPITILADNRVGVYPNIYSVGQIGKREDIQEFLFFDIAYWLVVFKVITPNNTLFLEKRLLHMMKSDSEQWGTQEDYQKVVSLYLYDFLISKNKDYGKKVKELKFVTNINQDNFNEKERLQSKESTLKELEKNNTMLSQKFIHSDIAYKNEIFKANNLHLTIKRGVKLFKEDYLETPYLQKCIDRKFYKKFIKGALRQETRLVSVDIFDTLLLRGVTPEEKRFYIIGEKFIEELTQKGVKTSFTAETIMQYRLDAAQTVYRHMPPYKGVREAKYEDIIILLLKFASLPQELLLLYKRVELEYEKSVLFPNKLLLKILYKARQRGKKIICLSDMYFSSNDLLHLVQEKIPYFDFDEVISSADLGIAKHSGHIYPYLLRKENIEAFEVAHCGDNRHSDFSNAKKVGINAFWTPRPKVWRSIAKRKSIHFKKQYNLG